MLEHVATRSSDPELRAIARRTLVVDAARRTERRLTLGQAPAPRGPGTPDRTITDAGHQEALPGRTVRTESGPACADPVADQAYNWLGVTFDFYATTFDRASIDNAGLPMISTVHYGQQYDNAFWNGSQMVYGDGDGTLFTCFTGPLDVTGHELTHGVTQYSGGLDYYGQPGALNESLSDVFGSLIKQYHLGQTAHRADWLIGQGLLGRGVHGVALRSMKAPGTAYDDPHLGKDPQPATMAQFVQTHRDNGGVHINSGIPNRAFYLAAKALGGNAWERAGRIWYQSLTGGQLRRDADFATFAELTLTVTGTLYGPAEVTAVRAAWTGVGVMS
ncbi:MAG TPA: M4 family metallopeptidase [Streptosporangiaceae bacterium]|nr:M4 family metallopeptidase [Streptosporangiaceae bacterium]